MRTVAIHNNKTQQKRNWRYRDFIIPIVYLFVVVTRLNIILFLEANEAYQVMSVVDKCVVALLFSIRVWECKCTILMCWLLLFS